MVAWNHSNSFVALSARKMGTIEDTPYRALVIRQSKRIQLYNDDVLLT